MKERIEKLATTMQEVVVQWAQETDKTAAERYGVDPEHLKEALTLLGKGPRQSFVETAEQTMLPLGCDPTHARKLFAGVQALWAGQYRSEMWDWANEEGFTVNPEDLYEMGNANVINTIYYMTLTSWLPGLVSDDAESLYLWLWGALGDRTPDDDWVRVRPLAPARNPIQGVSIDLAGDRQNALEWWPEEPI